MITRLLIGFAVVMLAPSAVSLPCSPEEPCARLALKCMTGPVARYSLAPCLDYDMDRDGDVDLLDWADWIIENPEASQF